MWDRVVIARRNERFSDAFIRIDVRLAGNPKPHYVVVACRGQEVEGAEYRLTVSPNTQE